jgi:hypothetical protein
VKSNFLLSASATLFWIPFICWLYTQQSASMRISAYFLAAMWSGEFFVSSMFALCGHPTADALSPKAKKHASFSTYSLCIASHTETIEATNSKELFCLIIAW